MSDPKPDARPRTDADPDGRDHSPGLDGATTPEEVDQDERFANSREDGVVDKHNYLDDVGDAVASTLGSVIGAGRETDAKIDDERDPKPGTTGPKPKTTDSKTTDRTEGKSS